MKPFLSNGSSAVLLLLCLGTSPAAAVTVFGTNSYSPHAVYRVDGPATQTILAAGGNIVDAYDVDASGPVGLLVVSTNGHSFMNDGNGDGAIVFVDRNTGAQSVISNNSISLGAGGQSAFSEPRFMDFDLNGDLIVADGFGKLIRVNPGNGAQTTISSGGLLGGATGAAVESTGNYLVTNFIGGSIVRVAPGGAQSLLSSGGLLGNPYNLALDDSGMIFATDAADGQIVRVDPISGAQTLIASGGLLGSPGDIDFFDGYLYVASQFNGLVRVDPTTGAQFVVTTPSGGLGPFTGVAVVPEPSSLALAAAACFCASCVVWRRRRHRQL